MKASQILIVLTASVAVGALCGWAIFRHQYSIRVVTFDRSKYDKMEIDWGIVPILGVQRTNTQIQFYSRSAPYASNKTRPLSQEDLRKIIFKFAAIETNQVVCFEINENVTITDLLWIESLTRQAGLAQAKLLLKQTTSENKDGVTPYREIRLARECDLDGHLYRWYIEREEQKARKQSESHLPMQ